MKTNLLIATVVSLAVYNASASSITYFQNNGTLYQTPAVSTFTTYGSDMAGMDVWATFSDGSTQHAIWAVTGATSGAATVGGYFSISVAGDTYFPDAWTLQNLSSTLAITSFTLFGVNGDTIFDRTLGGALGTTGSALGRDFNISGTYAANATYSDILNISGSPAVGDEFEQLQVVFSPSTLFGPASRATFSQDADNAAVHGTITTVPDTASTGMIFSGAFLALAALKRKMC